MSIFDRLKGESAPELSSKAAILLGCILMISCDGDIDDDELAIVRRLDGDRNTDNWNSAVKAYKRNDTDTCIGMVCSAIDRQHVLAFIANLIDISMADGSLAGMEKRMLENFVDRLKPDLEFVKNAIDVIGAKNSITTV